VNELPAELLRKGRFDEIFFVDLPRSEVRAAIFAMHLKKRKIAAEPFDLNALAAASDGFSGAEIEQAVVSALYDVGGSASALDQNTLINALHETKPLSVLMHEQVQALREWATSRCVPAD
jgi:SpoVK/Ycf46/Vps4 family AAA+-type ATPase